MLAWILSTNRRVFLSFLILIALLYGFTLPYPFLSDDIPTIRDNPVLGDIAGIHQSFLISLRQVLYFILIHLHTPATPWLFRLPNLLFHLGAVFLGFKILEKYLTRPQAYAASLLYAAHPLLTESVTWIAGGIYAQYVFLTFAAFLTALNNRPILSTVLYTAALLTCEKAAVLPVLLVLAHFTQPGKHLSRRFVITLFLGTTVWAVAFLSSQWSMRSTTVAEQNGGSMPTHTSPLLQIPVALTTYGSLALFPHTLTFYHSDFSQTALTATLRIALSSLYLLMLMSMWRKDRTLAFFLTWPLLFLAPTLTPLGISWLVAERYAYGALLGPIAALVYLLWGKIPYASLLTGVVLLALGIRTIYRNHTWRSEDALWIQTAQASPTNPLAFNNLGDVHARHGDKIAARDAFLRAIALNPTFPDAYHNLGVTYLSLGEKDHAQQAFEKALSFNPKLWQSYFNLGVIAYEQQHYEQALSLFERTLTFVPRYADVWVNKGITFLAWGKHEEAAAAFTQALTLQPQHAKAQEGLKQALSPPKTPPAHTTPE